MEENLSFKGITGEKIAAIVSKPQIPNGKGIILLHCFLCTKQHRIMRAMSESLLERGFTTFRFDFYGNGESQGRIEETTYSKMISQVKDCVSFLEDRGGVEWVGLAGHSMGAMLSLLSAYEDKRIGAVAFIAGSSQAARVREVFPDEIIAEAEEQGHSHASVYGRDMVLKREFLLDIERYNVGHAAAMLARPILIVHGGKDEVIPPFHARQIYNWTHEPKTLEMIDGADHLFKDETHLQKLKESVGGWFSRNL
jgi:putative redox protein